VQNTFSIGEAKRIVADLFVPNLYIYWSDFLFHISLGWISFFLIINDQIAFDVKLLLFFIAGLSLYRSVLFIHELAHFKKGTFRFFKIVWNLTCGFPLMVPSFTYLGVHIDHHKQKIYGTQADGEYMSFAFEVPMKIILMFLGSFLAPLVFLIRFMILTPLSYVNQKIREFTWEKASSLVIDLSYRRTQPTRVEEQKWKMEEGATCFYGWIVFFLMVFHFIPFQLAEWWYGITTFILLVNMARTLVAHGYQNPPNHILQFEGQFLDSITIPGNPIFTPLWAPVGLRFHAVHHLFPGMPYHSLKVAHRRLLSQLPKSSVYFHTIQKSWLTAFKQLWLNSWNFSKKQRI
jgi:fatty acid desaturase